LFCFILLRGENEPNSGHMIPAVLACLIPRRAYHPWNRYTNDSLRFIKQIKQGFSNLPLQNLNRD